MSKSNLLKELNQIPSIESLDFQLVLLEVLSNINKVDTTSLSKINNYLINILKSKDFSDVSIYLFILNLIYPSIKNHYLSIQDHSEVDKYYMNFLLNVFNGINNIPAPEFMLSLLKIEYSIHYNRENSVDNIFQFKKIVDSYPNDFNNMVIKYKSYQYIIKILIDGEVVGNYPNIPYLEDVINKIKDWKDRDDFIQSQELFIKMLS